MPGSGWGPLPYRTRGLISTERRTTVAQWLAPSQIAKIVFDVFVADLHEAVESYSSKHGLGPWKMSTLTVEEAEFRGQPVELGFLAAMLDLGPLNVELLQAHGSDTVVSWFERDGDGSSWHPVAYFQKLEQAEDALRKFVEVGIEPVFSGRIAGSRYWVFDTEELLGCRFEIAGGDLSGISFEAEEELRK
jgi:hypothetical protein